MAHAAYAPDAETHPGLLTLSPEESHHLVRVLRARAGDEVRVIDGRGGLALGRIADAAPAGCRLDGLTWTRQPGPSVPVGLVQALPKGERLDWILQKAAELGAASVDLVETRHCVTRFSGAEERKLSRCRGHLLQACKQALNPWLPVLRFHPSLEAWAVRPPSGLLLFGDLHPGAPPLRDRVRRRPAPASATVAIGPEGDFAPEERECLLAAGGLPVSLGPRILRTETAAIFSLSILTHEWLDEPPPAV